MLCSNCGKDIPFNGNVCPFCHADKSGDQMVWGMSMVGGLIGGGIGYAANDFMGFIAGMVIGMIPMMLLGLLLKENSDAKTGGVPTLPNLAATLENNQSSSPQTTAHRHSAASDGPGRYRIVGVVKATGRDIKAQVDAASRSNAKVKAELKGIIVTAVERIVK